VDFSLSDEQELLALSARALVNDVFDGSVARQAVNGSWAEADKGWSDLHSAGFTTLLIPESAGGGGGTLLDACLVVTELYRALAPVPYLASAVVAPLLMASASPDSAAPVYAAMSEGQTFGVVVDTSLRWPANSPDLRCIGWRDGRPAVLVGPADTEVIEHFDRVKNVDPLHLIGARTLSVSRGSASELSEQARRSLAGARVAAAAALAGCLAGATKLAWDYVSQREQYGRPIASFQVVRHMAADLLVDVETCRSVCHGAAWQVDNADLETAERIAAIAKAWCGQAAIRSIETSIQLLGGIGVTWESTAHLYLRTAHTLAAMFGDTRSLLRHVGGEFIAQRGGGNDGSA
jgi:alkylation response protein AidB-like acyl-CoA dehydrogenase